MALLLSINAERNMARDLDSIAVPGKRLRMVYEFREKDLKFCQDALAKRALMRPLFNLELGELFQTSPRFA
jgi:hypothetical protein